MGTGTLISVSEYLSSSYRPDCDYVDGVLEERNLGERDHSNLQGGTFAFLFNRRKQWGIHAFVEWRVQVSPTRFRVPDVCVVAGDEPKEQILRTPPFMCIEILSPDDRMPRMRVRLDDYLKFGVPYIFLIDPAVRKAFRWTSEGLLEVHELRTENPAIVVPLADLFE